MLLDPNPPEFPAAWAVAFGEDPYGLWQAFEIRGVRQVMRWIPPGRFWMGSPEDEEGRRENETRHEVTLSLGFWLAETACTQALWEAVMRENPAHFKENPEHPVENISWEDSQVFLEQANGLLESGPILRLPTEAQWEYACRTGTDTAYSFGEGITEAQANFDRHLGKTVPVHRYAPNPWGLYQMHGNVREWCSDWFGDYLDGPVTDPAGPSEGHLHMLRGGSWFDFADYLRSTYRYAGTPDFRHRSLGFRLVGGIRQVARISPMEYLSKVDW